MPDNRAFPGLLLGMARFYHDPRGSIRGMLASAPSEGRLLGYLMVGMVIVLTSKLVREAAMARAGDDFLGQATAEVVAWLFLLPLVYFGLAALGTMLARLCGGKGTWRDGRGAYFWATLVSAPLVAISTMLPLATQMAPDWVSVFIVQIGPVFFVWALAQCYAEAFGFKEAWSVFAAICAPIIVLFLVFRFAE